jgi:membrane fusion protein (multidrug efflux system)
VPDALAVPAIAVIPELGGTRVFVVEGGRAQPRAVTTGIRTEKVVQVTDGLVPGDLVITTGILLLEPGLAVEVEDEPVPAGDGE